MKPREYGAVASIWQSVPVEPTGAGVTVFSRAAGGHGWTAATLTEADVLGLPEIGIAVPVAAFYEGLELVPG